MEPFYNPNISYEENFKDGPFGAFADGKIYEDEGEPAVEFLGQKLFSNFGIPAGPLLNGKFVQGAFNKGFDICTYKTVRSHKYPCHQWPNVLAVHIDGDLTLEKAKSKLVADTNYEEPISITNSFGVPSMDSEFWQKEMAEVVKNTRVGQVVVGSFQGTKREGQSVDEYINDYKVTAKMLLETGVKIIEVNLSCPNEGTNALLCFDTERSVKVVQAIKEVIGEIPLIIKIAYFENDTELRNFVQKIGGLVQGISAINTISAEIVDSSGAQALPGGGRLRSGVCGHAIKWAGIDMVKKLKLLREELNYKYAIIGVGGVMTPEDYQEYIQAGADAVLSATGAMWNPLLAQDIKKE